MHFKTAPTAAAATVAQPSASGAPTVTSIERISLDPGGVQSNNSSNGGAFSPDGTKIAYVSSVPSNGGGQILVLDLATGTSTSVFTFAAGFSVFGLTISADGTKIGYSYREPSLSASPPTHAMLLDIATGTSVEASKTAAGVSTNAPATFVGFTPDGEVMFSTSASNLPNGGTFRNVYAKDMSSGAVTILTTNGAGAVLNGESPSVSFSPDHSQYLFTSTARNVVPPGDTNDGFDVYLRNVATGATVKFIAGGFDASFSPDGTKVLFLTASALVAGDTNFRDDLYIEDLSTGTYTLVTVTNTGVLANEDIGHGAFSPDGTKVIFTTIASTLVPGDINGTASDVFVKDLNTGDIVLISRTPDGNSANAATNNFSFSPDGHSIAFATSASDIVAGDTNGRSDLFLAHLEDSVSLTVIGTPGDDNLVGGNGDDYLDGLAGADHMAGGRGNDIYVVDNALDSIVEAPNVDGGTVDRVYALVDYTLAPGVAVEILAAGNAAATDPLYLVGNEFNNNLWGNEGDNRLVGGAGDDALFGFGGNDLLIGNDGNDFLVGGAGNDTMGGGTGDDLYLVEDAGDQVNETAGEGFDRINSTISYGLAAGSSIEILAAATGTTPIDLTGNELDNNIWGNAGANVLTGGAGADAISGGDGSDTLFGGDGNDSLDGGFGNDALYGGADNDQLQGGTGDDYLDGGSGADVMNGGPLGAGNDIFVVDNVGDVVLDAAGDDLDRVYASVSYVLTPGSGIEILATQDQSATTAIDLTGNDTRNNLWGNEGANHLDGAGGADALFGFGGDDTLIGGSGNDLLVGGAGNDSMSGGTGNDIYLVEDAGDTVTELINEGVDQINVSFSYTLAVGNSIEILSTADVNGTTAINLTGNEIGNNIWGNAGANTLSGGDGNDSLSGGLGDDSLLGGNGNDLLDGGAGNDSLTGGADADIFAFVSALGAGNVDTINDFVVGVDKVGLASALFGSLTPGALAAGAFNTGATATDADDRILYDSATGALYYDADGVGGGAAVQFATMQTGLSLTASDFQVI